MNIVNYFIIHCKEHTERLSNLDKLKALLNVPITIFDGFYTKLISVEYLHKLQYFKNHDPNMSMPVNVQSKSGEIGCYLSHHMLIKHIMDKSNKDKSQSKLELVEPAEVKVKVNNMQEFLDIWDVLYPKK